MIVDVGGLNMGQDLQDYGQHGLRNPRDQGFHEIMDTKGHEIQEFRNSMKSSSRVPWNHVLWELKDSLRWIP